MIGRPKITVVGAGNVGTSVARWVAAKELGDIVLVDIIEGLPKGKAIDLWEMTPLGGFDVRVTGGTIYEATAGSDLAITASGVARKPGMTREDLIDVKPEDRGGCRARDRPHVAAVHSDHGDKPPSIR